MPEVFAVLLVFAVAIVIYVAMWFRSRDPSLYRPHEEVVRMKQQLTWLDERLARARREHWDAALVASIVAQQEEVVRALSKTQAELAAVPGIEIAVR